MVSVKGSEAVNGETDCEVGEIEIPIGVYREMGSPTNLHLQVLRSEKTRKVLGLLLIPLGDGEA